MSKQFKDFESEGQVDKLLQKSKDSPFVPIGKSNQTHFVWWKVYEHYNRYISYKSKCVCVARDLWRYLHVNN